MVDGLKKRGWQIWLALRHWRQDDGSLLAAAMAYYGTLSFFPLLVLLASVLGFVLRYSAGAQDAQRQLLALLAKNTSPALAHSVETALAEISTNALISGPLGALALLFAAVVMFTQLESIFDRIWNTRRRRRKGLVRAIQHALVHRLKAFLMLFVVGVLIFCAFIAGMVAVAVQRYTGDLPGGQVAWNISQVVLSIGLNWALFTLMYKILPRVKVRWADASRGANLAAILWEIARQLLAVYLMNRNYSAYGVVGSVIVLMLWILIASSVLLLGAMYVRVIRDERLAVSPE